MVMCCVCCMCCCVVICFFFRSYFMELSIPLITLVGFGYLMKYVYHRIDGMNSHEEEHEKQNAEQARKKLEMQLRVNMHACKDIYHNQACTISLKMQQSSIPFNHTHMDVMICDLSFISDVILYIAHIPLLRHLVVFLIHPYHQLINMNK